MNFCPNCTTLLHHRTRAQCLVVAAAWGGFLRQQQKPAAPGSLFVFGLGYSGLGKSGSMPPCSSGRLIRRLQAAHWPRRCCSFQLVVATSRCRRSKACSLFQCSRADARSSLPPHYAQVRPTTFCRGAGAWRGRAAQQTSVTSWRSGASRHTTLIPMSMTTWGESRRWGGVCVWWMRGCVGRWVCSGASGHTTLTPTRHDNLG